MLAAGAASTPQIVSSQIRANDPTVLDVVYKVVSDKATVNVRALAFEDGERSFAKVVRPETFVQDVNGNETAQNTGDNIEANVLHTLSWKVSSDWATKLAKVKFEILTLDSELLSLKTRTIPSNGEMPTIKVTTNVPKVSEVFDALLWLYASKDSNLVLSDGLLKCNGRNIAYATVLGDDCYDALGSGDSIKSDIFPEFDTNDIIKAWDLYSGMPNKASAIDYVYSKMGLSPLTGEYMEYASSETRLQLLSYTRYAEGFYFFADGYWPFAYKIIEE